MARRFRVSTDPDRFSAIRDEAAARAVRPSFTRVNEAGRPLDWVHDNAASFGWSLVFTHRHSTNMARTMLFAPAPARASRVEDRFGETEQARRGIHAESSIRGKGRGRPSPHLITVCQPGRQENRTVLAFRDRGLAEPETDP